MTMTRRSMALGCVGLATAAGLRAARSDVLPLPTGKTILTVSGKISVFNDERMAKFDRASLEALGLSEFTTSTPWYDKPVKFEGVLMSRLMQAVGATGDLAIASALNDYETKIPMSDFSEFKVLLALKRDGEYMPVRDKGPLFVVYPFDSDPVLKSQRYYARSAWQLARLVIA